MSETTLWEAAHVSMATPLRPPWPQEWVPGLHGGCCIEATTRHLPTPLACSAQGTLQMTFDGRIWRVLIGDALIKADKPNSS